MDNKDYEYIQKEFKNQREEDMKPVKVTRKLIDELLNKYNACYYSELYYDSAIYDEDRNDYSKQFTDEEWKEYKKNYDTRKFNNWVDEYSDGNWGITITGIKKMIIKDIKYLKKYQYTNPKDIRFYMNVNEKGANIYFYGRDLDEQCDHWFCFYNKEVDKCLMCKKTSCWRSNTCGEKQNTTK